MVGGYRVGMHFLTSAMRLLEPRPDDDFVDRLHYLYTSTVMLMFALLVSAKQYVGHPIECFVPAQFTRAMEQYTENYCWTQNTYFVQMHDYIPHRLDDRERRQIGYYQWVPFVLAICALFFHIPSSVWRVLSQQSGVNVGLVVQLAVQDANVDPDVQAKTVDVLSRHIDDVLQCQRDYGSRNKSIYLCSLIRVGRWYGAYTSTVYVFIKCLHLSNVIIQFMLLNRFLETADYPLYGAHAIYDLVTGREWRDSGRFPRVTLCDFEIRVLGNVHRHTVQCVLVTNMFTEKIFLLLWLWFLCLASATAASMLLWLATLSINALRVSFVSKFLECESERVHDFVKHFLKPDGVFILQMIASHGGNIVCARVTEALWLKYVQRTGKFKMLFDDKLEETASSTDEVIPPPLPPLSSIGKHNIDASRGDWRSRRGGPPAPPSSQSRGCLSSGTHRSPPQSFHEPSVPPGGGGANPTTGQPTSRSQFV